MTTMTMTVLERHASGMRRAQEQRGNLREDIGKKEERE